MTSKEKHARSANRSDLLSLLNWIVKKRKRRFAVENLGVQGKMLVDAMLDDNTTYRAIVETLRAKTGESVVISSLQRYHVNNLSRRRTVAELDKLYRLIVKSPENSSGKELRALLERVISEL